MKKAQLNISAVFGNWGSIKVCYRFFSNEKVKAYIILQKHIKNSVARANEIKKPTIIIQDTSYTAYKTRY